MGISVDDVKLDFNSDSLWLLNICLAIVMFGVALDLRVSDFKLLLKNPKPSLIGIFSQFILLPFLTFLLVLIFKPIPSIAIGMILVAACPGGNISNFMTHLAKGNSALSFSLTAFATLVAVVMTPLNLEIWGSLYPPTAAILKEVSLDPFDLFKTIALIMIVPLVFGMVVNYWRSGLAHRLSKILKPVSITIFIAFVVIAFAKNTDIFLEYFHYVVFIVLFHNAIAILSGYWTARIAGLPFKDQKTLAIETGIQNSGLGLILVFGFFQGLGGMAIVAAWWGIWHIISGLTIAGYWSRNAQKTQKSIFKKIWYYYIQNYVRAAFQFYFSKIIVKGQENIPASGPVIFVANHQNALLDALVIPVYNRRHTHFLVRADVFKSKFIKMLVGTLNMMPVFRVRDGMSSIKQNDTIFNYCFDLLAQGESILIFPEGNHSLKRRIRPLSKGFTRLAFGAIENNPELKVQIVPVGLNYEDHQGFRKGVSIYFGEPIIANDFYNEQEDHQSALQLKEVASNAMKKLVTHVEDLESYDQLIQQIESSGADFTKPNEINSKINEIIKGDEVEVAERPTIKTSYFLDLFKIIATIINFLPIKVWNYISTNIKDPVMVGTFRFGVGISVFPMYYFIISAIVGFYIDWIYGLCALIVLPFTILFMVENEPVD